MLQGFLSTFPQYNPPGSGPLGVNLFAESYGGKYGPIFAEVWEKQNIKRKTGVLSTSKSLDIHLASLGIVNGCVDSEIEAPGYLSMAVNNTYGLRTANSVRVNMANGTLYSAGGCLDLIQQCHTAVQVSDPDNTGTVASVNRLCMSASKCTNDYQSTAYFDAGRSVYDLANPYQDPFPPYTFLEYTNTEKFQRAIGTVVNFTLFSNAVQYSFYSTGDFSRGPIVPKLAALLNSGVRIGLMYGDRDYICNWMGGEAISLNLAWQAGGSYASRFPAAGYAPIIVNDSYIGGVVRQYGNLSFSRIYQAGHSVPSYQPETAFQVFARIIMGTSVSTGAPVNLGTYNTSGPLNATQTHKLPPMASTTCWLRAITDSCSNNQIQMIQNGQGVVINGVLYSAASDWPLASITTTPSPTTSPTLTGLFTATSTPDEGGSVLSRNPRGKLTLITTLLLISFVL
jgi:carboxypeptidase C (cathepsin A)